MASKVTLTGARLVLRPPRAGDVEERLSLGNAPEIMRMFGVDPATLPVFTIDAAEKDLQRVADHLACPLQRYQSVSHSPAALASPWADRSVA